MGKGDKKTKRGKILMGSHGVRRPRRKPSGLLPLAAVKEEKPALKEKPPAKPKSEKAENVLEAPQVVAQVEEAVKPPKKKAPPKASSKKEDKAAE